MLSVAEAMGDAGGGGAHFRAELRDAIGGHTRECAAEADGGHGSTAGDKAQLVKAFSIVTARCTDCVPAIGSIIALIGRTPDDDRYHRMYRPELECAAA